MQFRAARAAVWAAGLAACAIALAGCGGPAPLPAGVVFPSNPTGLHAGKTYAEWTVEWWRWAFAQPATNHPLLDTTGAEAARGQSGDVWFLGATFGTPESVTRTVTVPAGKALFFPLYTWQDTSLVHPAMLIADRIAMLDGFAAEATGLTLKLDGRSVPDLRLLRAKSPGEGFTAPLAVPDDLFTFWGGLEAVPQVLASVVVDGYWAFIEPLPAGEHTIVCGGTHGSQTLRATYHITVE